MARPFCALRGLSAPAAPWPAPSGAPPPPHPSASLRPGARLPPGSPARPPCALASLRACGRLSLRSSGLRVALRPLRAPCSVALALLRAPLRASAPARRVPPARARFAASARAAPGPGGRAALPRSWWLRPPGLFLAARAALAALAVPCRGSPFLGQGANEGSSSTSLSPRVDAWSRP